VKGGAGTRDPQLNRPACLSAVHSLLAS